MGREIRDPAVYLRRMSKPLKEKLKVAKYFQSNARSVLDVGCADGTLTIALAKMFPHIQFLGIDLNQEFVDRANRISSGVPNVKFECVYLRELLARKERYDVVLFCSVLHEFYTYGEGISSVLKALADAYELLPRTGGEVKGRIIIRDMILDEHTWHSRYKTREVFSKITILPCMMSRLQDFQNKFGFYWGTRELNHFLLKYWYTENWERECNENYVPVSIQQYHQIFALLRMSITYQESYLLPFLANKWKTDFGLTDEEISQMRSTTIMVATKEI